MPHIYSLNIPVRKFSGATQSPYDPAENMSPGSWKCQYVGCHQTFSRATARRRHHAEKHSGAQTSPATGPMKDLSPEGGSHKKVVHWSDAAPEVYYFSSPGEAPESPPSSDNEDVIMFTSEDLLDAGF
ncbi:hypothetical protein BOTBODRAFT_183140 [Botryobasidium botryosum FD-172 SS1]|uniref:C2H2-type domain-containing protein n=1 Tax=Botryobasidium botryosum (strain FD-172 SS1) TaxID=930990 RepID=A0A067N4P6_BOTB1|nr:hypothetical protein BOTBODRAFT_183140 [Botryobasidium botryosum FD-172 SS1]